MTNDRRRLGTEPPLPANHPRECRHRASMDGSYLGLAATGILGANGALIAALLHNVEVR
jgi:hypothetical protein